MDTTAIKSIFQQLDGKQCYIKSGGLLIDGSIEVKSKLEFSEFHGLVIYTPLQWNSIKIKTNINSIINNYAPWNKNKEGEARLSSDMRDILMDKMHKMVNETWVKSGWISLYDIKSIKHLFYTDGLINDMEIQYKDSTVSLSGIK